MLKTLLASAVALAALCTSANAQTYEIPAFCSQAKHAGKYTCTQIKRDLDAQRVADANRKSQEELRQRINTEYQKRAEEQRRLEEIEAKKPINRLIAAYQLYDFLQFCVQGRAGYAVVYINRVEMERAKEALINAAMRSFVA